MAQTTNLPARTFPVGVTVIGPNNIPNGTTKAEITLDVSGEPVDADGNFLGGLHVWIHLEWSDDGWATSKGSMSDFSGPGKNKVGVIQTKIALTFATSQATLGAGWEYRATITVENTPFDIAGGTLVLS